MIVSFDSIKGINNLQLEKKLFSIFTSNKIHEKNSNPFQPVISDFAKRI